MKKTAKTVSAKDKAHNYYNTFIEVADDCPVQSAEIPRQKGAGKSTPVLQYEMIQTHPYKYTQEDVLFSVFAIRGGIAENDLEERAKFFSKPQPCLRCSSLGKRYGWGIHFDERGKAAIFAMESNEYGRLAADSTIKHVKAMRSSRS